MGSGARSRSSASCAAPPGGGGANGGRARVLPACRSSACWRRAPARDERGRAPTTDRRADVSLPAALRLLLEPGGVPGGPEALDTDDGAASSARRPPGRGARRLEGRRADGAHGPPRAGRRPAAEAGLTRLVTDGPRVTEGLAAGAASACAACSSRSRKRRRPPPTRSPASTPSSARLAFAPGCAPSSSRSRSNVVCKDNIAQRARDGGAGVRRPRTQTGSSWRKRRY